MSKRKEPEDTRDVFDKALDYAGPAGGGAAMLAAFFAARKKGKKIWLNGRWVDDASDDVPTWVRPHTPKEKADQDRAIGQWLRDAAADPKTYKRGALLGAAAYGGSYAVGKKERRK